MPKRAPTVPDPTAAPIELAAPGVRATVLPVGAALRSLACAGVAVVEDFGRADGPGFAYQGDVLAPWPNRVIDSRYAWGGVERALEPSEPERGHALHGLVTRLSWSVAERASDAVALAVDLEPTQGWPFPLRLRATYALAGDGLRATIDAENRGDEPCPYGAGAHPYLALRGARVDDCVLRLPAATHLGADARLAPTGRLPTAGTPFDLSAGAPLGGRVLDTAFTDVARTADGWSEARLETPDGHVTTVRADPAARFWQVFSGDPLPAPWTRRALAVEPMTCAPDALNSGDGLLVLAPGERHRLAWSVTLGSG